jgi:hypothetical protein
MAGRIAWIAVAFMAALLRPKVSYASRIFSVGFGGRPLRGAIGALYLVQGL